MCCNVFFRCFCSQWPPPTSSTTSGHTQEGWTSSALCSSKSMWVWPEPRGGCGLDVVKGLGIKGPDVGVVIASVCVC